MSHLLGNLQIYLDNVRLGFAGPVPEFDQVCVMSTSGLAGLHAVKLRAVRDLNTGRQKLQARNAICHSSCGSTKLSMVLSWSD